MQRFETKALHGGYSPDATGSRAVPVHRTSAYLFKSADHAADLFALRQLGNIYTRLGGPTQEALETRLAQLEGGKAALALASGTAAIHYTVINICRQGDELVSSSTLYGGTHTMFAAILPDAGITTRFVDIHDLDAVRAAINERTRLIFTEVIGNPALDVANIEALSAIAHEHKLPLVVDATFCTPYLFRPLEYGADIVIHSLTKWIGGHGTAIGGAVVDGGSFDWTNPKFALYNEPDPSYHGLRYAHDLGELNPLAFILRMRLVPLRNLGACLSPDNCWIFLQGLETLALRMERHSENALQAAEFLAGHPKVSWVRYPGLPGDPSYDLARTMFPRGFGGMVVFGVKGGLEAGRDFIGRLRLVSHLANVGDAKSLAIHPASTTHSQLSEEDQAAAGITPDLVRFSVGIEHIDDILADLDQALE
ncbi:MAG: O-acetylhomoserine aminocarboxypropyltransferase/cysteine synthase [Desulfomicrobium sp.]|nr:O-acetylhomoserine aminocarboxypropyltransferase/cysteine synthase [Pseudomonadota bacterium]MBV1711348.1 O-acetylhomoserine aminocarboxypropyltransferase/cysteine synthase [Desulfomicrobium sp.]MBU4570750.1 O-acetylhomoserine aminocarboxypropyltransferase/cysteine synthase [Pseudomonadota bacterium]MBU4595239.1 O-acetylhomoserine aminocarboxypropyltransferase/cysteine synthase [Pseudomonadota bacterium]MBV1720672.1 O-acetylhomoserine aminocarboxypropyltransferase/cysteine synthase [Desulfom